MTKIGIIGATGAAGKEITKEAVVRGLETTAIVRNLDKAKELFTDSVSYLVKDAFALTKEDLQDFDVIIDAYAPSDVAKAYLHVDLATRLIAFFRTEKSPRLFFILGAGSLSNGKEGHVLDDLENIPDAQSWIEVPRQQAKEYAILSTVENVDWVGVSPGLLLKDGDKKSSILGTNTVLFNNNGVSETSTGTLAAAIIDEILEPKHIQERFTVIDKS